MVSSDILDPAPRYSAALTDAPAAFLSALISAMTIEARAIGLVR
jgi:hypothetical protein